MNQTTDALLAWLRDLIQARSMNVAAVADAAGIPRARLRKVLTGRDDMTVAELLTITQALQVTVEDMGLGNVPGLAAASEPEQAEADDDDDDGVEPLFAPADEPTVQLGLAPLGNHPRQLFEVGFALGCDFLFLARVAELVDSGVPPDTLARFEGKDLPIKLDATYHRYNAPRYNDDTITLTLSFDALYECTFPWSSIRQLIFFPAEFEATQQPEPTEPEPEPPTDKRPPFLRLVD